MNFKSILAPVGLIMVAMALTMLAPAMTDLAFGNRDWQVFLVSALVSGVAGLALFTAFRAQSYKFSRRDAVVFIVMVWVVAGIIGGLPFYFSRLDFGLANSFFESVSGLTTTGATIMSGLDEMAPGILLWRSILHWIGGIGIVVLSVFIFPMLSVGGQQLFSLESSDKSDKPFARFADYASKLLQLYVLITLLCALSYILLGMSPFDGINHAMATVSSGGFSTSDSSFGQFNSEPLLWAACVFMLLGGLPFVTMLRILTRQRVEIDQQIIYFLSTVLAAGL
ncbi:MAG: TrkH family potassium uptake protein, partial [Novosphingobium sp.]|nr:TrkH family potassium uptake protein [Novosphingobium sp.]